MEESQCSDELQSIISAWALSFIKEIEVKHDVTMIYAVETGSRGYGTQMNDSDFDIKGFFINKRSVYSSVMGGARAIRDDHVKVEVGGKSYELDFEFNDFRKFLKNKLKGNKLDHMNFRFFSPTIYLNRFSASTFREIQESVKLPTEKFFSVSKGFFA